MPGVPIVAACLLALAQPSGRPPLPPLARFEPRVYEVTFEVSLSTLSPVDLSLQGAYRLADAPICMPVVYQGAYSFVASDSLRARLWLSAREDPTLAQRFRLDDGYPFQT